jgi:hypothetical protein
MSMPSLKGLVGKPLDTGDADLIARLDDFLMVNPHVREALSKPEQAALAERIRRRERRETANG